MKNNLGVDPDEWFVDIKDPPAPKPECNNPLDSMPIAKENPRAEEEVADWFADEPEKKEDTMHEKMYRIATARYNPFSLGGSENCDSDISCNIGGSENIQSNT